MAAADVRVTLTADDQATEIVRRLSTAVKQLEGQNRTLATSTKASADAAAGAEKSFGGFAESAKRLAEAFILFEAIHFASETITAAKDMGELAEKTGISTQALSAFGVAAASVGISQEVVDNGLKFLARSVTQLQSGVPGMTQAFAAFGLTAKDFKGLTLDQIFIKVADAQSKFGDGAGKTAEIMKIFGRSGNELIPLLHDLANGGFDEADKKAKELGVSISGETAAAALKFTQEINDLKTAAKGLVLALAPLIESFGAIAKGITDIIAHHPDIVLFTEGMLAAAVALKAFKLAVEGFGVVAAILAAPEAIVSAAGVALVLALGGAIALLVKAIKAYKQEKDSLANPAAGLDKDPALDRFLEESKPQVAAPPDAAAAKALAAARVAAIKQAAQEALAAQKSADKQAEEIEATNFAKGLIDLRAFYAAKTETVADGIKAEQAALIKERDALAATPLDKDTPGAELKRKSDIAAINAQIAKIGVDGQTELLGLVEQERLARQRIADEVRGFQEQILKAQGNDAAAAQQAITTQVNKFVLALQQQGGHTGADITAQATQLRDLLQARADFAQLEKRASQETADIDRQRAAIQLQANLGLISERDATDQILALDKSRVPTLENIADRMDKIAHDIGDPALIESAEKFRASFAGVGVSVTEAQLKLANLKETLLGAAQSDLSRFLGDTITHVNSLSDAFKQLAGSIVSSFQRVLSDIIASAAIQQIRNLLAPVGGGGIVSTLASAGVPLWGFAEGGYISGPGTGTSDSIPARLSHGEYVVRAAAVQSVGVDYLNAINGARMPTLRRPSVGGFPGFASGGLVSASGGSSSAAVSGGIDATFGLEDGLVLRHLTTRGGIKALEKLMSDNPGKFRAALGV
jgi:hypothetical protein